MMAAFMQISYPLTEKILNTWHDVKIPFLCESDASSLNWTFTVQMQANLSALNKIMHELQEYCERAPEPTRILALPKKAIFVKHLQDNRWYRARVVENQNFLTAKVYFVDFGMTMVVTPDRVRPCIERLVTTLPEQTAKCQLQFNKKLEDVKRGKECFRALTLSPDKQRYRVFKMLITSILADEQILVQLVDESMPYPARDIANYLLLCDMPFSSRNLVNTPVLSSNSSALLSYGPKKFFSSAHPAVYPFPEKPRCMSNAGCFLMNNYHQYPALPSSAHAPPQVSGYQQYNMSYMGNSILGTDKDGMITYPASIYQAASFSQKIDSSSSAAFIKESSDINRFLSAQSKLTEGDHERLTQLKNVTNKNELLFMNEISEMSSEIKSDINESNTRTTINIEEESKDSPTKCSEKDLRKLITKKRKVTMQREIIQVSMEDKNSPKSKRKRNRSLSPCLKNEIIQTSSVKYDMSLNSEDSDLNSKYESHKQGPDPRNKSTDNNRRENYKEREYYREPKSTSYNSPPNKQWANFKKHDVYINCNELKMSTDSNAGYCKQDNNSDRNKNFGSKRSFFDNENSKSNWKKHGFKRRENFDQTGKCQRNRNPSWNIQPRSEIPCEEDWDADLVVPDFTDKKVDGTRNLTGKGEFNVNFENKRDFHDNENSKSNWNKQGLKQSEDFDQTERFQTNRKNINPNWDIQPRSEIHCEEDWDAEIVVPAPAVVPVSASKKIDDTTVGNLTLGNSCKVFVSFLESIDMFHVQEAEREFELQQLQFKLRSMNLDAAPAVCDITGMAAAKNLEDGQWYRVLILDKQENSFKIYFVDYGNSGVVSELKELPEDIVHIPHFSTPCRLPLKPVGANVSTFSLEAMTKMESLVFDEDQSLVANVFCKDHNAICVIDLIVGNKSVSEVLEKENHAVSLLHDVYVCSAASPMSFYVHFATDAVTIELMEKELSSQQFRTEDQVDKGDLCIAKFEEDGLWYRAKVTDILNNEIHVLFIDYGNFSVVSELRKMPETIINIPAIAKLCCLKSPPSTEKEINKFMEISNDCETLFKILLLTEEKEAREVVLLKNNKDIIESNFKLLQYPILKLQPVNKN